MIKKATAKFRVESWAESPYNEIADGPKLTRASVRKTYKGDIAGESELQYLMMHRQDGTASFVGLERVVGNILGRAGSFVLQHSGTFEDGIAKVHFSVLAGSGTGELHGLQGQGDFASGHADEYQMLLDYDLK